MNNSRRGSWQWYFSINGSTMSVYSFSREGSTFSVGSWVSGTARSTASAQSAIPEDPLVAKERKKLYGISARKCQKPPDDSQLVMFDPTVIHFPEWRARFDKLLELREIEDEETRKAIMLKSFLPKTIQTIPTLFRRHEEPFEKDTDVILAKLQDYYDKIDRRHRIKSRIQFFSSAQGDMNFYQFANSLKEQLFECHFGAFEEDALVTSFVMGLENPVLRKHLLEKEIWLTSLIDTVELAIKFQDVLPPS